MVPRSSASRRSDPAPGGSRSVRQPSRPADGPARSARPRRPVGWGRPVAEPGGTTGRSPPGAAEARPAAAVVRRGAAAGPAAVRGRADPPTAVPDRNARAPEAAPAGHRPGSSARRGPDAEFLATAHPIGGRWAESHRIGGRRAGAHRAARHPAAGGAAQVRRAEVPDSDRSAGPDSCAGPTTLRAESTVPGRADRAAPAPADLPDPGDPLDPAGLADPGPADPPCASRRKSPLQNTRHSSGIAETAKVLHARHRRRYRRMLGPGTPQHHCEHGQQQDEHGRESDQ